MTFEFAFGLLLGGAIAWALKPFITRVAGGRQQLRLSDHARTVIELTPNPMVSMASDGSILDFNSAAEELLEYQRDEVIGKPLHTVLIPEESREAHVEGLRRYIETGESHILGRKLRLEAQNRSGRKIPVELTATVIHLEGQVIVIGFLSDLTERSKAESHLRRARASAEEASRLKSEFLANMSHEIRTPLNAILGYSALLAELNCQDERRPDWSRTVRSNGQHLLELLNGILDLSKIEAGALEVRTERLDLTRLMRQLGRMTKPRADEKGLDLSITVGAGVPEWFESDSLRVRQIMLNLMSNAIKFTDKGKLALQVEMNPSDQTIHLLVEDTGPGLSPKDRTRALEPFTRIRSKNSAGKPGTGLGLDVSARLARLLGGELLVDKASLGGSRFTLVLPCSAFSPEELPTGSVDYAPNTNPRDNTEDSETRFSGKRFLVAEDSPVAQRLMEYLLESWGAEVTIVGDGLAATQLVLDSTSQEASFDAILMDMQMPMLDGYEATRQLRQGGFEGSIIGVTADAFEEDRERCLASGCTAFLAKPVDASALRRKLSELMVDCDHKEQNQDTTEPSTRKSRFAILFQDYRDSLVPARDEIEKGVMLDDVEVVRRTLHQLKGVAGSFGDKMLSERATMVETALRNGSNLEATQELIQEVIMEIESLVEDKEPHDTRTESNGKEVR